VIGCLQACLFGLPGSFWVSAFEPFKSQKAPGSQKPEAHYNELLGFWLMGAVWLLESPKASSLKVAKSSNKQGDAQQYENPRRKCEPLPSAA